MYRPRGLGKIPVEARSSSDGNGKQSTEVSGEQTGRLAGWVEVRSRDDFNKYIYITHLRGMSTPVMGAKTLNLSSTH